MREELQSVTYLSDFEYLYSFRRYSPSNFEVVQFFHVLTAKILLGERPSFGQEL